MKQPNNQHAFLAATLCLLLVTSSQIALGGTQTVQIQGFAFNPPAVTINVGDTVTWVQKDTIGHTTTSTDVPPVWSSPLLSLNQTFSFTFNAAGTYAYICTPHPWMQGSVTVAGAAANSPPTVQITSPADGATLTAPTGVTLTATAADSDGSVTQVEFLDGATSVGIVMAAPYSLTLSDVAVGSHVYTAIATDNQGATSTSTAVTITVNAAPINVPPTIKITSPTNGMALTAPTDLTITALASDADGTVSQVEFLEGTNSLGVITSEPYNFTITKVTDGVHQYSAKVTDNQGASTNSTPVTIVVNTPASTNQTVLINKFAFFPKNLDVQVGDTVTWVQKDTTQHTVTSDATPQLWNSGLMALNQTFSFQFTAAGTYPYYCIPHQTNPNMHGTITVLSPPNVSPIAQITSPTNGTALTAPTDLTITASASDADGTVSQVEFLEGATSLGIVTTAPYSLTIKNVTDGVHQYIAKATDNQGATTNSAPVTVVVNTPASTNQTVLINKFAFFPKNLDIQVGATVTWVQKDTTQHTVTSDATPPLWNSGLLALNQTFSFQFNAAGTYPYYCIPHQTNPNMHGTITVLGAVANLPVVSLTRPGKGAVFMLPTDLTLQATASETNGVIDHVEFYAGGALLGTASQSPYSLTWSNVPAGDYLLTAKAFDIHSASAVSAALAVSVTESAAYLQHNLVSDIPGLADHTDTNLVNPWGNAFSGTGPFWISDNHAGVSTLYDTTGAVQTLVVTIPPPTGANPPSAPTGIIYNSTTNFQVDANAPAHFIFSTEDGTIAGWNTGSNAVIKVDNSANNAIYKGLALGKNGTNYYLFATDFHNGKVDVFNENYSPVSLPNGFTDATIPAGFAPFGIHNIAGNLYVTYAQQDANKEDDLRGPGLGYVNVFDTAGNLIKRFASAGVLNSPWGITLAPDGYGTFSGALLIGNFGDGRINAFDSASGSPLGWLSDANNKPISIEGLWDIKFGNNARGGDGNRLYFTAGISGGGNFEDHGLLGSISAQPTLRLMNVTAQDNSVQLAWVGGIGPYLVQQKTSMSDTNWTDVLTTPSQNATLPEVVSHSFFRVLDNATHPVIPFTVLLTASNEVPATASSATGLGLLSLSGSNLTYQISYAGLTGGATAAHVHGPADATVGTGVLFPLSGAAGTDGLLSGSQVLTAEQIAEMVAGQTYVNIHTPANKGGEIRGQVVPLRIPISMNGAAEVPAVSSPATATGWVTLIGNQMSWEVNYSGLTAAATAAHVHGPADTTHSTGVLFPLPGAAGTTGTLTGTHTLTQSELNNVLSGLTYMNIHTGNNSGGEIRGQIWPWQFPVNLSGGQEVPATTSSGTGSGVFYLAGNNLTYNITYRGLTGDATAAHVHGPADQAHSTGVLFPLTGAAGPAGTLAGTQALTAEQVADIITGNSYANIHTAANPGGEIRGQLIPAD